jgi:transcriptional regulator with XRE-family HTH domain
MKDFVDSERENGREVKLGEILQELIKRAGYNRNRKEIAQKLQISESRLSQYVRNQEKPSFHNLLRMAEFFGVSLDYLVYGEEEIEAPVGNYEPLQLHTEMLLDEIRRDNDRYSWTKNRIAQIIMEKIDTAADRLLTSAAMGKGVASLHPDLLLYKDVVAIEQCSTEILILTTTLQNDVIIKSDGTAVPGSFLYPVAQNLKRKCKYRYVMPILPPQRDRPYWEKVVDRYRRLLHDSFEVDGISIRGCEFKVTDAPVLNGCVLYHIDVDALNRTNSILLEQIQHAVDAEQWVGCSISPSEHLRADMLMDTYHLGYARLHFRSIWANAGKPL